MYTDMISNKKWEHPHPYLNIYKENSGDQIIVLQPAVEESIEFQRRIRFSDLFQTIVFIGFPYLEGCCLRFI